MAITIRELDPDEWEIFRDMRLVALTAAPGVYGSRYQVTAARSEAVWRNNVRGDHNQSFGLFDGAQLIGITSVFRRDEEEGGKTAILALRRNPHFTRVVVAKPHGGPRRARTRLGGRTRGNQWRRHVPAWRSSCEQVELRHPKYQNLKSHLIEWY